MSRGATARLFVAVDPPVAVCEELAVWARGAALGLGFGARAGKGRRLRLLEPDMLHLTLCFLGSRPVVEIEEIATALEACDASAGELFVGAPLWLPPRRPRTLVVSIADRGGELGRLHESIVGAISRAIGWEPERRRFRAHVTVARMGARTAIEQRSLRGEAHLPATPPLCFTPTSVVLYRSWLSPAGATYEAITTRMLTPSESNASDGEEDPTLGSRLQTSVEPPPDGVGLGPSSHSGSDPSSQE